MVRPGPSAPPRLPSSHEFRDREDLHSWWRASSPDKRNRRGGVVLRAQGRIRKIVQLENSKGRSTTTWHLAYAAIESFWRNDVFDPWVSPAAVHGRTTGIGPYAASVLARTSGGQPSDTRGDEATAAADRSASTDVQHAFDVSREKYLVGVGIAEFVLRGIHATEEVARQQLSADRRWLALESQVPTLGLTVGALVPLVTHRLFRLFRSLASEAREDGLALRPLTEGESWSLDLQFNILERLPVRPDETSEFLRALLLDVLSSTREGRTISGSWGEVQFRSSNDPELVVVPSPKTQVENTTTPSPVRFSRVRRSRPRA
jgi:hypothetical protein